MRIERRAFLMVPGAAAVAALVGLRREAAAEAGAGLSFDDYVARVGALAQATIADAARNEEAYLHEVAALSSRVERVPDATLGQPFKGIIRTGLNYRGSGIVVVQWAMEPGLVYPAHNHPNYNGVTLGIDGECRIRNFTPVGELPDRASAARFEVRLTQDQVLTPGRVVSVMSTERDNIHTLRTFSRPVRGIDVMTLVGKHVGFSFVVIDEKTRRGDEVFDAAWGERRER